MKMRACLLVSAGVLLGAAAPVHDFISASIAPDGRYVASIEGDEGVAGTADIQQLVVRKLAGGQAVTVRLPCGAVHECTPSSLAWAPDGQHFSFVLRAPGSHAHAIYTANADGSGLVKRLSFNGTLVGLSYGADGEIAVLATENAAKEVGAVEAGAALTGELGATVHEQRIAVLGKDGKLHYASPPDLFVYEYDWRPGGKGFIGTAAPGDGDNNWWIAKLYQFSVASFQLSDSAARIDATVIYAPASAQLQIAQPVVSPDGKNLAFIGGLMSDFGATGGDIYVLPLDKAGVAPVDITAGWPASVMSLRWNCDGSQLVASLLKGDQTQIVALAPVATAAIPKASFSGMESLRADGADISSGCHTGLTATIHQSFATAAEIATGPVGQWTNLTHVNANLHVPVSVKSITWHNEGFAVQGWLLLPAHPDGGRKLAMVTDVHGGPAWASQPHFIGQGFNRKLLDAGYAVFMPNPRGSYGQGEAFTRANVKDFGYGDLRDILAGIDEVEKQAPIDDQRLGLTGWSYGGFMTMFAVTQTNRFKAAVAGAGISNWESYYGENGIDQWMIPYFGASVYADPAVYAKSSAMSYITRVKTPTLEVVGENDVECPAPQTMEFWHALHDLGVPTQSVIYPGEGHAMRKPEHLADFQARMLGWFGRYLK